MAKNKSNRKKSITTKNTQRKVKTFGIKNSNHHNWDNVTEFVNNVDNLLERDEIPYEEKQKIINAYIFIHEMNNQDVPDKIFDIQYKLFIKELIIVYNTDKERFFNAFKEIIEGDIIQSKNLLNTIKEQLSKEDAEQLKLLIDSKIYRI